MGVVTLGNGVASSSVSKRDDSWFLAHSMIAFAVRERRCTKGAKRRVCTGTKLREYRIPWLECARCFCDHHVPRF